MSTSPAKSPLTAILAASVAAIGASVCCVVPLVLVVLGISGAWIANLTALVVQCGRAGVLGLGLRSLYGPSSRCRADGECVDQSVLRHRRRWLWIATVVIVLLLLFPYYVPWLL